MLGDERFETFTNRFEQLVDILGSKLHFHSFLFHLPEIQQLVYQEQQTLAVTVNNIQIVAYCRRQGHGGFHYFLQRSYDKGYRCAYFVGYHGEELDFGFVYFFFLIGVQFVYFSRMFLLCPFDDEADDESESYANQYKIEQFGSGGPIERRVDGDFQTGSFFIPYSVIIGRLYFEKIGSCGQIGVSGLILGAYIVPVFVKSFQFIGVFVFIGGAIA